MPNSRDLSREIPWPKRVNTPGDAVRFIDAVGFCLLFPVKNVALPSLYYVMARRIPITWDKYTIKRWAWKDNFRRNHRAHYERFYAAGRSGHDARAIWKALADHGPLAPLELRHACKMDSKAGNVRFKKAMNELQCLLIVTHFGAEQETAAWASGRFELTTRAFSKQAEQARGIMPESARAALARKYLEWHRNAPAMTLTRLFGWSKADAVAARAAAAG